MQTRKYPRTLDEAFGPYTSHVIHDPLPGERPLDWEDRVVIGGCVVTALIVLGAVLVGWIV